MRSREDKRFIAALAVSSFVLNWFWEMAQMPAFVEMAERTWLETALPCGRAALGDVLMTFSAYGIGALAAGNWRWGYGGRGHAYVAAAILGAMFACAYEWNSQATGRWTYNDRMPIVPELEVGLWPLLQLVVLIPASLASANAWMKRGRRSYH